MLEFHNVQIIGAGVLIEHVMHTQKANLPKIKKLKNIDRSHYLEIDLATRRNLENLLWLSKFRAWCRIVA